MLLAAVVSLGFVRTSIPVYVYALAVALSMAAIYATVRRASDFRVWALYILAFVLFAHLRTLADETGNPARFAYAIGLERALFIGNVPTIWLQEHLYAPGRAGALELYSVAVYVTYFFAPHLVALAVWRLNPSRFRQYAVAILVTYYLGLTVAYIVPTAPPWLAGQTGDLQRVFRVGMHVTNQVTPGAYEQGYEVAGTNDVAAMPSLHMAITLVIAFVAWRFNPLAGAVAFFYAASMGFALVYLGEHYVVDLLAGLLTAVVAWKGAAWWWQRNRAPAPQSAAVAPAVTELPPEPAQL